LEAKDKTKTWKAKFTEVSDEKEKKSDPPKFEDAQHLRFFISTDMHRYGSYFQ